MSACPEPCAPPGVPRLPGLGAASVRRQKRLLAGEGGGPIGRGHTEEAAFVSGVGGLLAPLRLSSRGGHTCGSGLSVTSSGTWAELPGRRALFPRAFEKRPPRGTTCSQSSGESAPFPGEPAGVRRRGSPRGPGWLWRYRAHAGTLAHVLFHTVSSSRAEATSLPFSPSTHLFKKCASNARYILGRCQLWGPGGGQTHEVPASWSL